MIEVGDRSIESICALRMALTHNPNISAEQSDKNIHANTMFLNAPNGIPDPGFEGTYALSCGRGNCLRITEDGFLITAHHNIAPFEDRWRQLHGTFQRDQMEEWTRCCEYSIRDIDNNEYPIDITCWATVPAYDIAIIKAITSGPSQPIQYKVLSKPKVGDEIKVIARKDSQLFYQLGKVTNDCRQAGIANSPHHATTDDTFLTDAYGIRGFSGGSLSTLAGELAGIAVYAIMDDQNQIGHIGAAKAKNFADLAKQFAAFLLQQKMNREFASADHP